MFLSAYLFWKLRSLIIPVTVGGMTAYICRPVIAHLERYRIPRTLAMGMLLVLFILATLFVGGRISAIAPSEIKLIELKIHGLYKLNEGYNRLMGLDRSLTKGNRFYQLSHEELDPIIGRINRLLALSQEEESQFLTSRPHSHNGAKGSDRLSDYHRENLRTLKMHVTAPHVKVGEVVSAPSIAAQATSQDLKNPVTTVGHILSAWFIAPLVFLFLLRDTGQIRRGLLRIVPNRLFEPTLTVMEDLDHALGDYLRGIFIECVLLGVTVTVLLVIVGVSPRWAIAIGLFTGITNVIPYLGFAFSSLAGLAYALLADEIHPLLPMVNPGNFVIFVIAAVGLAEVLKNIFYEPLVLGAAVKLHPLVVVIGVVGGGILFDVAGVLLAVPTITVFKVFISSSARQLKSYGLM
jgi:predicted PurR-regulated permease PerM